MTRNLYPSSNQLGIPDLHLGPVEDTPPGLPQPVAVWGTIARKRQMPGTWLFYTDDYRFESLWRDPQILLGSMCSDVIEPNFSVFDETPRAEAAWQIYRKRWLARHWQRSGIRIWVDLFVAHQHLDLALSGVPLGWQRYATSGQGSRVAELDTELELATETAAGNPYTLLVYGGDKHVREWCSSHSSVLHVPHRRSSVFRPGEGTRRKLARQENSKATAP